MCVFASAVFINVEKLVQPSLEKFMTSAVLCEGAKEMVSSLQGRVFDKKGVETAFWLQFMRSS